MGNELEKEIRKKEAGGSRMRRKGEEEGKEGG